MPTDLLIVRHGQSTWNALGRWQGHADPPLSDHGRLQADTARQRLERWMTCHSDDRFFDLVMSSDLARAHDTARIALGHEYEVVSDPAFRERAAGEWEGLTRADLDARWPDWQETGWRPDGFETDIDVLARVLPALDALVTAVSDPGTVRRRLLIVSHGGVVRALDRHFEVEPVPIVNLAGRWFHHDDGWSAGDYVELAADVTDSDVE